MRAWWDVLVGDGPKYGYFLNPAKSVLVVKEPCMEEAKSLFQGTDNYINHM